MEYQNLSKSTPINIGLFFEEANDRILSNKAYLEINEILSTQENLTKYTYSIYADTNIVRANIFMPILNTLYIGCKNNNIIISSDNDLWLLKQFTNNKYYCLNDYFTENMALAGIKKISSVKEIL